MIGPYYFRTAFIYVFSIEQLDLQEPQYFLKQTLAFSTSINKTKSIKGLCVIDEAEIILDIEFIRFFIICRLSKTCFSVPYLHVNPVCTLEICGSKNGLKWTYFLFFTEIVLESICFIQSVPSKFVFPLFSFFL